MLRDTSRKRPALVRDWLSPRAARASGLAVHEATMSLRAAEREAILAAHGRTAARAASAQTVLARASGELSPRAGCVVV